MEKEAALERERKDREAAEKRNQVLAGAENKAQKRIRFGTLVLILTMLITVILGVVAQNTARRVLEAQQELQKIKQDIQKREQKLQKTEENRTRNLTRHRQYTSP